MDRRAPSFVLPLYGVALFLSAALLFNVQPMVGKLLLPRVGGSPEVWNVAMAFFQVALLGGYLLAHGLGKLPPVRHGLLWLAALTLALVVLPIGLPADWRPEGSPPLAILGVLVRTVALPFVALSLGAPTLQRLFSATAHESARDPYFLYAASNAGSFFGLLLYPLVLEPWLAIDGQTRGWTAVYVLFLAVAGAAVAHTWRSGARAPATGAVSTSGSTSSSADPAPTMRDRLTWLALAAVPSSLTLGVTTHISTDVAATPLLWAITLGLYLLTFVVAFGQGGTLRAANLLVHPWLGAVAVALVVAPVFGSWAGMVVQLVAFTSAALACHTRLAALRPGAAHLTDFYLWLSIGGALGGSFNAFVAPVAFDRQLEYPAMLVLALALNPLRSELPRQLGALIGLVGAVGCLLAVATGAGGSAAVYGVFAGLTLAAVLVLAKWPRAMVAGGLVLVGGLFWLMGQGELFVARNFFGIVRVTDEALPDGRVVRKIMHGTTVHGAQLVEPEVVPTPIGYYSVYSPIAAVFRALEPQEVAVIGLGSGGMNCFAEPGQTFRFYEIDPLVETVARQYFTFLEDCPPPEVKIGDGRLLLAADPGPFDLIATDAFSSDSIPVHLLTTDAMELYLERLAPDGALVFHASSRYFDLVPVLAANGAAVGLQVAASATIPPEDQAEVAFKSQWVAMARDRATLERLLAEPGWRWVEPEPGARPWTDGYSNPVRALKAQAGFPGAVQIR